MGCSYVSGMVGTKSSVKKKLLFVVNVDWFFVSHRLPIAIAAQRAGFEVHIATSITDKKAILDLNGLHVHELGLIRDGVGLFNAVKTIVKMLRIFKKIQPDIVHLVTIKPVLLGGLVARWLNVPALVSAVSGLGYIFTNDGLSERILRVLVGRVYSWAFGHDNQVVIFQNPEDRALLTAASGLAVDKTSMIRGSGVDLDEFTVTCEPEGIPVVLYPARLLVVKGILEFVEAARLLRSEGIIARFVVAGLIDKANPTSVLEADLNAWVQDKVVENWGYRTDMPAVLSQVNLVVLPSYREGLPKVLLEAAACGRAVVTSDVAGCREAIEPNVTGVLVPVRDVRALADSIRRLLIDPWERKKMGLAGRCLAEREFDVRITVNKHIKIYQNLLA